MEDCIHTLAIGHHLVTASVEQDRVENPGGDLIFTNAEARRVGLLWSRRRGAQKRAGIDLSRIDEETEEEALAAGREIRAGLRAIVNQIPELPDRYNPNDQPPLRRLHESQQNEEGEPISTKYRRIEMSAVTDDDETASVGLKTPQPFPSSSISMGGQVQQTWKTHNRKRDRANAFADEEAMEAGDENEEESANNRAASNSRSSTRSRTENHSDRETDSDSESNLSFVVDDGWFE